MEKLSKDNRIGVLMFVDPALGISLNQAQATLEAVLKFNDRLAKVLADPSVGAPLSRLGFSAQKSTTTRWPFLTEFMAHANRRCQPPVHIYGNLRGLDRLTALDIKAAGGCLYGEWFAPSLDGRGVDIMKEQGIETTEAEEMLAGISLSLEAGALTGLEFQINKRNVGYVRDFIQFCLRLGIEPHLEMQEVSFYRDSRPDILISLRKAYRDNLPSPEEIRRVAELVAELEKQPADKLLSPFFDCGGRFGACNYWFENGLFVRPSMAGGLYRTVCLSDRTIIEPDFTPTVASLIKQARHPRHHLLKGRQVNRLLDAECSACGLLSQCRGGCRAMSYLAFGNEGSGDPNCWRRSV